MNLTVKEIKTETIQIDGAAALDPVTVVFRDIGPGMGGIIVECYGKAWSAYWGAIGANTTIKQFIAGVGADYLANRLWRDDEKRTKVKEAYLLRIASAIQGALIQP